MSTQRRADGILAVAAAAVSALTWASSFSVIRQVGTEFSPGALALARVTIAAILLAPLALKLRTGPLVPRGPALAKTAAFGLMWFAGYFVALNLAEHRIDAGTAALAVNAAPVLIAVGGATVLREQTRARLFVGAAVSIGGVAIMARASTTHSSAASGFALALVAAVLYAGAVLIQKSLGGTIDMFHLTWLGCTTGVAALALYGPSLATQLQAASPGALAGVAYLGIFPTALGFCTWAYALRRIRASRLSSVGYMVTVLSVIMSWVFLDEAPTSVTLAGGAICLAGVVLSQWQLAPRRSAVRAASSRPQDMVGEVDG